MEAACKGAHASARYREGDTIGVLPHFDPAEANPWVDIVLATGLDHARNGLVANADAVVAVGGGAGTLCEMTFAWMYKRLIVAVAVPGAGARSSAGSDSTTASGARRCPTIKSFPPRTGERQSPSSSSGSPNTGPDIRDSAPAGRGNRDVTDVNPSLTLSPVWG